MDEIFLKPYNPKDNESTIYKLWEDSGFFNPDNLPGDRKEAFTITLPPPNVTGTLHVGHAYEDSLQDAVIRYKRMRGFKTLWVPGTDSAAIATQSRVEKNLLKEENKTRHDIGRTELVKRVSDFAKNSESTILNQVKRMGASLDWSRYSYALDERRNNAVFTAFKSMHDAGLIYPGNRIINWDPKGQTTISDDEIVHEPRKAKFYTFRYSKDFPISIATTRPETKLGDVGVAVHPDDKRYAKYVGQTFEIEDFAGVKLSIKIVADRDVDPEFGTGAVGLTPAHSHTDWYIAERHGLDKTKIIINEYAKIQNTSPLTNDKKTSEAREIVANWIRENKLMENEEEVDQNVSTAERTGGIIEPLPKRQWFVAVDKEFEIRHSEVPGIRSGEKTTLKKIMRMAVESGAVSMPQENFRKSYFHWIDNLHDWCISRQIWFGHQIPAWTRLSSDAYETYLSDPDAYSNTLRSLGNEWTVQKEKPDGENWVQHPDVLDTWFSSSLWTFSTLGWPEKTSDLESFHPTSFMSPAYEIINLWISRMILMSVFHLGQVPFKIAMIHGLVRDKTGRKFSKSLGNGIEPLDIIEKYGTDALRMGLLVGTAIGNDINFDEQKVKGYKNFANKIWNITRFVLENTKNFDEDAKINAEDQKTLENWRETLSDITKDMDNFRFYLGAEKIYHYVWHTFADVVIEESKVKLNGQDEGEKSSRQKLLRTILEENLKVLHPFMPFVTETIWQKMNKGKLLMIENWPLKS